MASLLEHNVSALCFSFAFLYKDAIILLKSVEFAPNRSTFSSTLESLIGSATSSVRPTSLSFRSPFKTTADRDLFFLGRHFLGNAIWSNNLEWSGQEEYAAAKVRDWKLDGQVAGQVKSVSSKGGRGGLTCEWTWLICCCVR